MSRNIKDQISPDNVKKLIKVYIELLNKEKFPQVSNYPTIEIFPKGADTIGLSLIDENNIEIKCTFVNTPQKGYDYLFVPIEELNNSQFLDSLGENYANRKLEPMRANNAYSINLNRVDKLLKDGHNAEALVFLVSAFENITKDYFFLYHELWFPQEDDIEDYIYEKLGMNLGPNIEKYLALGHFAAVKEINGRNIGIEHSKFKIAEKWKNVRYWENIHEVCKKLRIYNDYIFKKQGNDGKEIGKFEILKEVLEKQARKMRVLNFQNISDNGGFKKSFETFFNIKFHSFEETIRLLKSNIEKRHKIIHGTLEDHEINEDMVINFKSSIIKLVSYLRDELSNRYEKYEYEMIIETFD